MWGFMQLAMLQFEKKLQKCIRMGITVVKIFIWGGIIIRYMSRNHDLHLCSCKTKFLTIYPTICLPKWLSAVAQWKSAWLETEGQRVQASPASLRCGRWARHNYPSLVLAQPRKTRLCLTERLLMGHKESNQTNQMKIGNIVISLLFPLIILIPIK